MPSQQVVTIDGTVTTTSGRPPGVQGFYVFSLADVPGVVAANNYITLFNPIGSGRTVAFGGAFVSSTAAGGTSVTAPMRGVRISATSGGTLAPAGDICKFVTTDPNAVAQVRSGTAVAATNVGNAFFLNSPPALTSTVGSTAVHSVTNPAGASFILAPGEGIALSTSAGDTDQRWNLSIAWGEI